MDDLYECALSGETAEPEVYAPEAPGGTQPIGWFRITVQQRQVDPRYYALMGVKQKQLQKLMEAGHDQLDAEVLIAATFSHLEDKLQPFVMVDRTAFISDSKPSLEALNQILEALDLAPYPALTAPDDEGDEADGS